MSNSTAIIVMLKLISEKYNLNYDELMKVCDMKPTTCRSQQNLQDIQDSIQAVQAGQSVQAGQATAGQDVFGVTRRDAKDNDDNADRDGDADADADGDEDDDEDDMELEQINVHEHNYLFNSRTREIYACNDPNMKPIGRLCKDTKNTLIIY